MTLKELILEIKSTPDEELRLLIEDRTDTILEGRSPIRKKNYLSDFKAQLKESSIEISLNLIEDLIIRTQEVLSEYDCVLKVEIEAILASKSTNLLNAFKIFLQKVRIYEETVIYLQDFREEIRKVLGDVTKGIDPELYNEIEKATRSNKIEEFIEFIFKIQLILLKVEKASRFASDLRTQLEHLIKKGYYKAFRIDLQKFLLINKPDSNNLALHRALKGLLLGLSLEKSEGILKNIAEMVINIKKKGHSDLWAKAQLLLLR